MYGHEEGNRVLKLIADTINRNLQDGETFSRINSDNFYIFMIYHSDDDILQRVISLIQAIEYEVTEFVPVLSFGIYRIIDKNVSIRRMGDLADIAKRTVKYGDDSAYAFYNESMLEEMREEKRIENEMQAALDTHEFCVFYQPKVSLDGKVNLTGAEALVRWIKDGTVISPGKFIPLFEKNGAIGKLDEYMFTCVCAQLSQWRREGLEIRPVSVNLSRASLCRQGVALAYKRILEGYGLSTWMVPLEVTESAMISDGAVISVLQEFYRYGFRIEIDDFGKAQSTLPMLKLPFVDTVKLDKSLIDCIGDRKGEIMLRQVVRLCYELGLYTTAEGVEAEDQVDFLRALDCTDIQGYFFSPPLPVEKYTEKLRQQARKRA